MYPPGHPRLAEALESLREAILEYSQKTGTAFVIEALPPTAKSEPSADSRGPSEGHEDMSPSAFLRRHRVKSILIMKGVTSDELMRLCAALGQDESKPGKRVSQAARFNSQHIRATPFAPEEVVFDISQSTPKSKNASQRGMRLSSSIPRFWERLSAKSRAHMQAALQSPEIVRRLKEAKAQLELRAEPGTESVGERVDLLGTVLDAAFADPSLRGVRDIGPEQVARLVQAATHFIEQNVEALTAHISSRPDGTDPVLERETILGAIQLTDGIASLAAAVHGDKQRLDYLFRTGTQALPILKAPAGSTGLASGQGDSSSSFNDRRDDKIIEGQLEAVLAGPPLDFSGLRASLETTDVLEGYAQVVFELLARGSEPAAKRQDWPLITETISHRAITPQQLERLIALGSATLRAVPNESLAAFLLELILKLGLPAPIARVLDEIVLPEGGFSSVVVLLKLLEAKLPKMTAGVCHGLLKREKTELKKLAEDRLLALSGSLDVLIQWALESPESLLQPRVLKAALAKHRSQEVFEAFRNHFVSAREAEAIRFLSSIPATVPGILDILYAAMESPLTKLRNLAIASLWKSSSPQTLSVVSEILKKNNTLGAPDMDEVQAALTSLVQMESTEAINLRDEILHSRRALRHVYRKEIRRALADHPQQEAGMNVLEKQS